MTRVGVIGDVWEDSFASNILEGLGELHVEGVRLGTSARFIRNRVGRELRSMAIRIPAVATRAQQAIVDRIAGQDLDLVITTDSSLQPATVAAIRATGTPIVLWFPDPVSQLSAHMMLACDYSTVYFKDPLLVERLQKLLDLPVEYMPEACNPRLHRPLVPYGIDEGLVTPGNIYPVRARLVARLTADGIPVRLYGEGFPRWLPSDEIAHLHQRRAVWGVDKAVVLRSATAVLNNLHIGEMSSVNCRLFDATGSGAVVLCEDRPALRDLFEVGTEVLAFDSYESLVKQYRWLVENPDEAASIGNAAMVRALSEHTHRDRLEKMLAAQL